MNDQIETSSPKYTKKQFWKLLGSTAGATLLGAARPAVTFAEAEEKRLKKPQVKQPEQELVKPPEPERIRFESEIHDGVEVFGLKEGAEIKTIDDIEAFYRERDKVFCANHLLENSWADNLREEQMQKIEVRQEMWRKKRMLEVVVRRSAWDEFERRKKDESEDPEFRVSFPTWIQCHVDLMNRCMENANPPCELEAELVRIVVVEDEAVTKQPDERDSKKWDEEAWREGEVGNLDWWWFHNSGWDGTFPQPVDIDTSWAVPNDYRPGKPTEATDLGY